MSAKDRKQLKRQMQKKTNLRQNSKNHKLNQINSLRNQMLNQMKLAMEFKLCSRKCIMKRTLAIKKAARAKMMEPEQLNVVNQLLHKRPPKDLNQQSIMPKLPLMKKRRSNCSLNLQEFYPKFRKRKTQLLNNSKQDSTLKL